jgi:hypothetical protein
MATYKVIQDIEAEDKLLGPLSLRQFIYAVIVIVLGFVAFTLGQIQFLLVLPFIPPIMFFGLLAAPFGQDQSSEVWLLAKIRFMFKPRRRIWDQSGLSELVTVTAPKYVEKHLTDGLDQTQVKSRLKALASTLDSRGWAVKNANISLATMPTYSGMMVGDDRLVAAPASVAVPDNDILASDDILDEQNNLTAQHLDSMINTAEQQRRQQLVQNVQQSISNPVLPSPVSSPTQNVPANDYWFMNQNPDAPAAATVSPNQQYQSGSTAAVPVPVASDDKGEAEQALLDHVHEETAKRHTSNSHIKRLKTPAEIEAERAQNESIQARAQVDLALKQKEQEAARQQEVARLSANNDLNITTISHEANHVKENDDEVVISLH